MSTHGYHDYTIAYRLLDSVMETGDWKRRPVVWLVANTSSRMMDRTFVLYGFRAFVQASVESQLFFDFADALAANSHQNQKT